MSQSFSPKAAQVSETIPEQDIFDIFQKVLEQWAFLPSTDIGTVAEGPAVMPLERMVAFSGPLEGFLVVRAPQLFGKFLWENISGEESGPSDLPHGDAFSEFVNLFFGHLSSRLRQTYPGTFDPFLPQASHPGLWPPYRPSVAMAILVDDIPVEIRFWMGQGSHKDSKPGEARG